MVCSWLHRSNRKQDCFQILPGEKGRNSDVSRALCQKRCQGRAVLCSPPIFSHPCIQPGLAKPHLSPCLAGPKQSSQLFLPTTVSVFEMSHTISKRALDIKCIHNLCFREFQRKSASFNNSWCCFYLHTEDKGFVLGFEGQKKGRMDENIYGASGAVIWPHVLCLLSHQIFPC